MRYGAVWFSKELLSYSLGKVRYGLVRFHFHKSHSSKLCGENLRWGGVRLGKARLGVVRKSYLIQCGMDLLGSVRSGSFR